MSDLTEWQAYIGTVCWESSPKVFVEETLLLATKIYQISVWTCTLLSLYLLFTDYSPPTEKMKLQILILAVALVTIIGPTVGIVFSPCELARVLPQCGLNYYVDDCKFPPPSKSISITNNLN
jgi:hypothetical protein